MHSPIFSSLSVRFSFVLAFVVGLLSSQSCNADQNKNAAAQLRGNWKVVSAKSDGKSDDRWANTIMTLKSGGFTGTAAAFIGKSPIVGPGIFLMIDLRASPDNFDLLSGPPTLLPGIYRYSRGTLTVCFGKQINPFKVDRPTNFTTKPNDGRLLMVFKKASSSDIKKAIKAAQEANKLPERFESLTSVSWIGKSPNLEAKLGLRPSQFVLQTTKTVSDKAAGNHTVKDLTLGQWQVLSKKFGLVSLKPGNKGKLDPFHIRLARLFVTKKGEYRFREVLATRTNDLAGAHPSFHSSRWAAVDGDSWVHFRALMPDDDLAPIEILEADQFKAAKPLAPTAPDRLLKTVRRRLPTGWRLIAIDQFALIQRNKKISLIEELDKTALQAKALPPDGIERSTQTFELLLKFDDKADYAKLRDAQPPGFDIKLEVLRGLSHTIQMSWRLPPRAKFESESEEAEVNETIAAVRRTLSK